MISLRFFILLHRQIWRGRWCLFGLVSALLMPLRAQAPTAGSPKSEAIDWQPWSDSVFADAKREHKFVLLDLQAVWCHWCHVMDEKTYSDPKVMALIQSHYIAVRVDQDSRPDLANRYEDYGWPATVVYNSDGSEIVKRSGFLPPEQMASMLQAIIDDPSPGPSVLGQSQIQLNDSSSLSLSDAERRILKQQFVSGYDSKQGSWGTAQKFLNWDNVEYCLVQAQTGDAEAEKMARQTLSAQLQLIDPIWGGVDQYSAGDDWDHPHFEKIMQMQAENLRIYSEAYALWKNPVYLQTARHIYGYVRAFLTSPEGVVYVSQDADLIAGEHAGDYFKLDDAGRRKLGIPRIDTHIYSRENGWFIEALTTLYTASGNSRYCAEALRAADWIIKNRSMEKGGFRHGDEKTGALYLGDNLAMGRAFLDLYMITGDFQWLNCAEQTASFIADHFSYKARGAAVGFATAADEPGPSAYAPQPEFDENVSLARFTNLLSHYTENPRDRQMAETAMRFITSPDIVRTRLSSVGGLLLAEDEFAHDPLHLAIVGRRQDKIARRLFETAIAYPCIYKQVEWFDLHDASSRRPSMAYPELPQAAAYLCANHSCSAPVYDEAHLLALLNRKVSSKNGAP
jgi:uncharacterized protein YyaL (SSP411 family)